MEIQVTTVEADGTVTTAMVDLGAEFGERWAAMQARDAELAAAGTPVWCTHEGRSVSHPRSYWQDDTDDPIYSKHGVRCADCGGYIQMG
jgi:hypothetical protein